MNKRPGHVVVTTEVAVCSFCGRPRTLRHEEHQLGTLVRTIITCETCHRTLSSTIGVATTAPADPEPVAPEPAPAAELAVVSPKAAERPAKSIVHRKAAATKATTSKSRPKKTR
jgi:hypothetical protein